MHYSQQTKSSSHMRNVTKKGWPVPKKNNQPNLVALKHTWPHPRKSSLSHYTKKATQLRNKQKLRFHVLFTSQLSCLSGVERQGGFSQMWPGMFQSIQVLLVIFSALVSILEWHNPGVWRGFCLLLRLISHLGGVVLHCIQNHQFIT